ncbi:MAG: 30S ribosomal protein S15 [Candidatus Diapherotrites archaeon]|nr:30S ribosomal protein S15 [Candidatus Diapherotrites archaeon]
MKKKSGSAEEETKAAVAAEEKEEKEPVPVKAKKKVSSKKKVVQVSVSPKEAEEIVVSLSNAGHSPSEIGLILRDEHGVKNFYVHTGKRIQKVMAEHKLVGEVPEDMLNLIKKSVALQNHLAKNKKDFSAKRGYEITVSKIRRLAAYYSKKGRIAKDWKYDAESTALLVK